MKPFRSTLGGVLFLGLVLLGLAILPRHAHAQCAADLATTPIDGGADNIICGPNTIGGNHNGGAGNDTFTVTGTVSGGALINGSGNDDVINNSAAFSGGSYITGGAGNDIINNSGTVTGGIIQGEGGNDTISLFPGSRLTNTWVDGDLMGAISGNTDLLILNSTVPITVPNPAPCHSNLGIFSIANMITAGCVIPWEGGTLYFVNFEQIQVILIEILQEQGISVELPPTPRVICDDGRVKVFKLPNGDVEYYSGFDLRPPNGFLVGKATLAEVANGIRTFSDPNGLGWSVVLTQTGNSLSGQVFDNLGNPVGNTCRH